MNMMMSVATIASRPPPRSCFANGSSSAEYASGGIRSGRTLQNRSNPTNCNSANRTEQSDYSEKRESRNHGWRAGVSSEHENETENESVDGAHKNGFESRRAKSECDTGNSPRNQREPLEVEHVCA